MATSLHRIPTIDAHVHVHPNEARALLRIMAANNVSRAINLGILERLGIPFSEGMRAFRRALGDRLVYFPAPDFSDTAPGFGERMAEQLERKVEGGACGLKVFKELGLRHRDADGNLIPVDDARLDPLWAKAAELDIPVLIHTADPVGFFQPLDEANELRDELRRRPEWHFYGPAFPSHDALLAQRNRVVVRHPGTTFIGAHLGNYPENLAYVDALLDRYPNLHVDTSARIGVFGRHPVHQVRAFFLKHQDRIVFGTDLILGWQGLADGTVDEERMAGIRHSYDAHWRFFETRDRQMQYPCFPATGRWAVDAIGLPDQVLEKLYTKNVGQLVPALGD